MLYNSISFQFSFIAQNFTIWTILFWIWFNRSSHSRPFYIGGEDEDLSEENDAAFEDNPLSSEENDVLNDPDADDLNNYRLVFAPRI